MPRPKIWTSLLLGATMLAFSLMSPVPLRLLPWESRGLLDHPIVGTLRSDPQIDVDFDGDGRPDEISLLNGTAMITTSTGSSWTSPAGWEVVQTEITDLNNDDNIELALLVWRAFEPWPIDAYLASPGRIDTFHDSSGQSCHLILIGWLGENFRELWAGSALADPIVAFAAADLDGGGKQALVALEGRYDDPEPIAHATTIWDWNGFGFTLRWRGIDTRDLGISSLPIVAGPELVIVSRSSRR